MTIKPSSLSFSSFVWGGFESACPLLKEGYRIDGLCETKHDLYVRNDYFLLKDYGIKTVREGLHWHKIDKGNGVYDFSSFEHIMKAGQEIGVQQIWNLNHFEFPEDADPFTQEFVDRFCAYAVEAVKMLRKYQDGTLYVIPFNEIGFYTYMAGHVGAWPPYLIHQQQTLRKCLVKASIAAMDAIWKVESDIQFIQVEPVEYWVLKHDASDADKKAFEEYSKTRNEVWDMLCGKRNPELGGDPKYLGIIGINYYYQNQKMVEGDPLDESTFVPMPLDSEDRISFADLLKEVYERYNVPIIITETGGYGDYRVKFWTRTLREIDDALDEGIPVLGVCAYPIIDRLDWHDRHLTYSGLWDFVQGDPLLTRTPFDPALQIVNSFNKKHMRRLDAQLSSVDVSTVVPIA